MLNGNPALHRGSVMGRVLLGTLFLICAGVSTAPFVCAQKAGQRPAPHKAEGPQPRGVTVGSDYFVPIPEVSLNRLINKKKPTPPPAAQPAEQPTPPSAAQPPEQTTPHPVQTEEAKKQAPPLPEVLHPPVGRAEPPSGTGTGTASAPYDVMKKFLEKPPLAPEDALEARTPAKATFENGKLDKVPAAMTAVVTKPGLKVLALDSLPLPEAPGEERWLVMVSRPAPRIVPLPPPSEPEFDEGPAPESEAAENVPPSHQGPPRGSGAEVERPQTRPDTGRQAIMQPTEPARQHAQGVIDDGQVPGAKAAPPGNPAEHAPSEPTNKPDSPPATASSQTVSPGPAADKPRLFPPGYKKGARPAYAVSTPVSKEIEPKPQ